MNIILEDNWLEIMHCLSFDLQSLRITCKYLYYLFFKYKKQLCHIGNYRLSIYQELLINDINDNCNNYNNTLIINPYNLGNKLPILIHCLNYKGTSVIFTDSSKFTKWYDIIKSLNLKNICILSKEYCDDKQIKFLKKHKYNPSCLDYKIIIMDFCISILYHTNHSKIINHSSNNIIKNCVTFTRETNPIMLNCNDYNYIEYKNEIIPKITYTDYCCYRDETIGDIYLDDNNDNNKNLIERLNDIFNLFTNHNYLLIKEETDPISEYKNIKTINYHKFFKNYQHYHYSHYIFLWPGHQDVYKMNEVYKFLHKKSINYIYIYNIYSTIEEQYLRNIDKNINLKIYPYKLLTTTKSKLTYLNIIRELIIKYGSLNTLPNDYFNLLMYVKKSQLCFIYQMIDNKLK